MSDPFRHHPALRGRIGEPETSRFRHFRPADHDAEMAARGFPPDWRFSDEEREARRRALLGPRYGADIWVFAYGSLMWDPAFRFAEVRLGRVAGYARRFCLLDTFGARGTPEAPGLQAGLAEAPGGDCTGLVFRIAAAEAEVEAEVVWRREALADPYLPRFLPVETDHGPVEALAFVANPASAQIVHLPRAVQVGYLATGRGDFGTSRAYLEGIAAQLQALGIEDPEIDTLLDEVRAHPG